MSRVIGGRIYAAHFEPGTWMEWDVIHHFVAEIAADEAHPYAQLVNMALADPAVQPKQTRAQYLRRVAA